MNCLSYDHRNELFIIYLFICKSSICVSSYLCITCLLPQDQKFNLVNLNKVLKLENLSCLKYT